MSVSVRCDHAISKYRCDLESGHGGNHVHALATGEVLRWHDVFSMSTEPIVDYR